MGVFRLQILGFLLKIAAESCTDRRLAYRDLRFEEGRLVLEDAILFDSSYLLRSEKISLRAVWKWPLFFSVHVEKPHILISPEHFKTSALPPLKSPIAWSLELEEGHLEWADSKAASSQFSLYWTSEDLLKVEMSLGGLKIEKKGDFCHIECNNLPCDFLIKLAEWSGYSHPFSSARGTVAFDGEWKGDSMEKFRFSLKDGHVQFLESEIKDVEVSTMYQADLGVKCEGKCVAKRGSFEVPSTWEGKGFFSLGKFDWVTGSGQFGRAKGSLAWKDSEWFFSWEGIGPEEVAVLQGFIPSMQDCVWRSGTVQGEMCFKDTLMPRLIALEAKNLEIAAHSFACGAKGISYKEGNWEIEEYNILYGDKEFQGNANWTSSVLWGSWEGIEQWNIAFTVSQGALKIENCALSDVEFTLIAEPESLDLLSAKGKVEENALIASFFAPRIQWKGEEALFDVRLQHGAWDLLRLKGSKEKEAIVFDPVYSHFCGEPFIAKNGIWEKGALVSLDFETEVNWPLFKSFVNPDLVDRFLPAEKVHFIGHIGEQNYSFSAPAWNWIVEKRENQWNQSFSTGDFRVDSMLEYKEGAFRVSAGHVKGMGIVCDFDGVVTQKLEGELGFKNLTADLHDLPGMPMQGKVEGQALVSFTKKEVQSNLDLFVKEASFKGFSFENSGSIHLYYSSLRGAFVKGIDCRIYQGTLEAHAKVDLLHYDGPQDRWNLQKAKTHFPSKFFESCPLDDNGYIDGLADLSFVSDFSDCSCSIKEAFFSLYGAVRHVQNGHCCIQGSSLVADALLQIQGNWAKVSLDMAQKTGTLSLEEADGTDSLEIEWSYQKEMGLLIHSIEGSFAGLEASFHAFEKGHLIGSSHIDFRRLSEWIAPTAAKSFEELHMGKGYELKGNLQIDPKDLTHLSFQGIFCGKEIELAGFQFRTLLGKADLSSSSFHIYDLKISDSAGIVKIEDLQIQRQEAQPWTIAMPTFLIEELRPSLLRSPGQAPGPISPLVLRHLKMVDFHGLLDDGKTYLANGSVSFINSFKRGKTVFDLPANIFGRLIGLDLELLIPVEGELKFTLKDGYFNLKELKGAYSEGHRSEFFLVESDSLVPRMDLDGNLEILVKMEQFVLFSLTKAFMISIEGKLNAPSFRLQKKKTFL